MVENKHVSKIIIVLMTAAVALCFLAMAYSNQLSSLLGGKSVTMEYESKLFDTDEVMEIDIQMDEDDWNTMLKNATAEEYYVCDVIINGKRINNVAIRPKGNTSLSAIAMDPDSDRFSFKLEFGHFVEGQTCYGLDKLILNNNYADATNMKEAIVYDMYQYLDVDASLYNYAKLSMNGEYIGVYVALEGVEDSFMLRNYGTQDGELYKPDTMEMGGGSSGSSKPGSSFGGGGFGGMTPPSQGFPSSGERPEGFSFEGGGRPDGKPSGSGGMPGGFSSGGEGKPEGFPSGDNSENTEGTEPSTEGSPGGEGFDFGNMPEGGDFDFDSQERPDMGGFSFGGGGGFSMNNGGANLNYIDDDLDSYSQIWDAEVTSTSKGDHRRVVTALKNISEGNDLEKYLDVDNILKYMAVHTFSVNMDSLSGSMSHNYYLYEYDGQLNIFPWDYNLSFGGMVNSSDATSMINDAIDTPFSGTKFFDALLENDEYRERYHAYLQQLVDEYVNGGRFDETYNRIRKQIDSLVENDPTAFYSYEEYQNAADIFYQVIKLRAESIDGQLKGTIPSTDEGQRQNSSALIDASYIDVEAMGQFDMGGSFSRDDDEDSEGSESPSFGFPGGSAPDMSGFDFGNMPEGGDFDFENMPDMSGFGSFPGAQGQFGGQSKANNLITYGVCLLIMLVGLFSLKLLKRK